MDAAHKAMLEGHTKYTPTGGLQSLKQEIVKKFTRDQGIAYDPSEIIVCNGAKHALYTLFQVLLDEGDEVIIPTPYWVSYPEQVKLAGGKPVYVEGLEDNEYKITAKHCVRQLQRKRKQLLLIHRAIQQE